MDNSVEEHVEKITGYFRFLPGAARLRSLFFITLGGPQAHGHSLTVTARNGSSPAHTSVSHGGRTEMEARLRGMAKGRLHNAGYFIRIERLGQHIVATQVQDLRPKRFVGELGGDNYTRSHGAEGRESEKLAPVPVGYDDRDAESIEKRGGFSAICGFVNSPPTGCEHCRERSTRVLARREYKD